MTSSTSPRRLLTVNAHIAALLCACKPDIDALPSWRRRTRSRREVMIKGEEKQTFLVMLRAPLVYELAGKGGAGSHTLK